MGRRFNKILKPFKLSTVQANILALLWIKGAMTIGEVQAYMAIGSSTITGAVDRMEKNGLLSRVPVEGDRRAYRLEPVTWPTAKKNELIDLLFDTDDEAFSVLSAKEKKQLLTLLRKVAASLEGEERAGGP